MSRAVRPRRPLGQPVMRGSILVVGGRGGAGGTSRVVRVLWSRTRGAALTLVAVVSATGIPVMVGTAIIPLTTRVVPLSMESTPVALENLKGRIKSQSVTKNYLHGWSKSVNCEAALWSTCLTNTTAFPADLFGWWRAVFTGGALSLGGRRSFQQARAGDRGGRGAATGPIWVACTRVINCKTNNKVNHWQYNLHGVKPRKASFFVWSIYLAFEGVQGFKALNGSETAQNLEGNMVKSSVFSLYCETHEGDADGRCKLVTSSLLLFKITS